MDKPVFALSSNRRILIIFTGWESLTDILHELKAYIVAKISIENEAGNAIAEMRSLEDDVLKKYNIPKLNYYVLYRLTELSYEANHIEKPG